MRERLSSIGSMSALSGFVKRRLSEAESQYGAASTPSGLRPRVLEVCLATAFIERRLGDLVAHTSPSVPVPHLLKDLLALPALSAAIPDHTSLLTRLTDLMGPPTSLNLRNLAWHGFLRERDLPTPPCAALLSTAADVDALTADTPRRPFESLDAFSAFFLSLSAALNVTRPFPSIENCCFVAPGSEDQWQFALTPQTPPHDALCMLLPLLEGALRRVFCVANDCADRFIFASEREYYCTMDEMMAPTFGDGRNELLMALGAPLAAVLHDLFSAPSGVRLRDRAAHGELDPNAQSTIFAADALKSVCVALCVHFEGEKTKEMCYELQFHPFPLARRAIESAADALRVLQDHANVPQVNEITVEAGNERCLFASVADVRAAMRVGRCAEALTAAVRQVRYSFLILCDLANLAVKVGRIGRFSESCDVIEAARQLGGVQ